MILPDNNRVDIVASLMTGMDRKRLKLSNLIADNRLDSGTRTKANPATAIRCHQ